MRDVIGRPALVRACVRVCALMRSAGDRNYKQVGFGDRWPTWAPRRLHGHLKWSGLSSRSCAGRPTAGIVLLVDFVRLVRCLPSRGRMAAGGTTAGAVSHRRTALRASAQATDFNAFVSGLAAAAHLLHAPLDGRLKIFNGELRALNHHSRHALHAEARAVGYFGHYFNGSSHTICASNGTMGQTALRTTFESIPCQQIRDDL